MMVRKTFMLAALTAALPAGAFAQAAAAKCEIDDGKPNELKDARTALVTAGMVATDALNGYAMSKLFHRADRRAAAASRIMSVAVASLSLAVAGLGLAKRHWPAADEMLEGLGVTLGIAVVLAMVVAFALAMRATVRPARAEG